MPRRLGVQGLTQALRSASALILIALLTFALAPRARADTYPARPIQIILSYPPAGAADILARSLAERLGTLLKQAVVVDNRPGAGGAIGLMAAAKARPDGYTLYLASYTNQAVAAAVYRTQPADLQADFEPIARIGYAPHALVVPAVLPVKTVAEFVNYVKAKPGAYNFASQGLGTLSHLEAEVFMARTGIKLTHIPYKGSSDAQPALITNSASMMFDSITGSLALVKAGKLRFLAVASKDRFPLLPDVPTLKQAGLDDMQIDNQMGVFAPKGTPQAALDKISAALEQVLADPALRSSIVDKGMVIDYAPEATLRASLAHEIRYWSKAVKAADVKVE
ncbi:receptor [Bordetella genomosp. 10]|uniref:Receptor n=1 Tax=Bordetella genomosp. 10 TaxID=1416804 RepID=A0A261SAU0_9BORD|nr:tripartite tricarboxylate transporter substrate binding protein [Bordetella genomosp. 10]OZI34201.1 receptor [Bordetella genomosp. 10]